jgi:two-component system KDP operon response regulator KdpE
MADILLVDDDRSILRALKIGLSSQEHSVTTVQNGQDCLSKLMTNSFDLIILDLGLPDSNGVEIVKKIRRFDDIPILVLSATHLESTKVDALDNGADDYVTKPFGMAELNARIRSLIKKYGNRQLQQITELNSSNQHNNSTIICGDFCLNTQHYQATYKGTLLSLTAKEFKILAYLAQNYSKVCTHRMILKEVWGEQYNYETEYLRVYIYRLRKKINDSEGKILQSNPGIGYSLNPN